MSALLTKFWRDRAGASAVEFALVMPLLLSALLGVTELGRAFSQANAVERSIRSAALFAARGTFPLTATGQQTVENIVKTGNPLGTLPYVASGWSKGSATVQVTSTNFIVDGEVVPVIRITADVPFTPLLPGFLEIIGINDFRITKSHEQGYVGS